MRLLRRSVTGLMVLAMVIAAGCVTETTSPRRGMRVNPSTGMVGAPASTGSSTTSISRSAPQKLALPDGPVASPAMTGRTTSSRAEIGVIPLGRLTYDGTTLPLISPDGRFIAVQEGEAPTWEVILAEAGAFPPMRAGIAVYEVGERQLKRIEPPKALPPGLVLGRSSDDTGFLVEQPQANGARWIGKVSWLGSIDWLVQGATVNAHAVLSPKGELVYTRRAIESEKRDLVVLSRNNHESVRPGDGGSYELPMCTSDLSLVYALRLSETGIDLEAIRLDRGGSVDGPVRLGASIVQKKLEPKPDRVQAFQIAVAAHPSLPTRNGLALGDPALAIFYPRIARMAVYRLETNSLEPLAPNSMAAISSQDPGRPGFYCSTTEQGMVFFPTTAKPASMDAPTVRILPSPYVPRKILGSAGQPESMMLFGPVKGRADELEVVKLVIGPPSEPPPAQD